MLHIITALYRFENLENVYNSILMNDDITWHIAKSNKREDLTNSFLKTDKRVKVYNVDCEDSEAYIKRREVLSTIKDGYFCFIDDDTLFHENMYLKYIQCLETNFVGMIIGEQINSDGSLRLSPSPPRYTGIDVGNVIAHSKCLTECEWPINYTPGKNHRDFLFWDSVYEFYGKKCGIWNEPISYYNKLNKNKNGSKKKTNTTPVKRGN
jgi:hypothetical protein